MGLKKFKPTTPSRSPMTGPDFSQKTKDKPKKTMLKRINGTNDLLPIDSEVQVLIGLGDETITVKGKVVWSQKWTEGDSPDVQSAMGIKILEAPGQYGKLCE